MRCEHPELIWYFAWCEHRGKAQRSLVVACPYCHHRIEIPAEKKHPKHTRQIISHFFGNIWIERLRQLGWRMPQLDRWIARWGMSGLLMETGQFRCSTALVLYDELTHP